MIKVIIFGSGSGGNCTYLECNETRVLIDAGLGKTIIRNRLASEGIPLNSIDAIFITHEHSDHIKHLVSLLKVTGATLYINEDTLEGAECKLRTSLREFPIKLTTPMCRYDVNDLSFVPIELSHDTPRCMGYLVKELQANGNNTYAQLTDTGTLNKEYLELLSYMNTVMIESNHDIDMLMSSSRPDFLKTRIKGKHGHLSNKQCLGYLKKFVSPETKNVILGHLSEECNDEQLALNNIKDNFDELPFNLFAARQHESLELIIGGIDD